jgi:predicted permease
MPTVLGIAQVGPIVRLFAELLPSLALGFWLGRIKPHWTRPLASPLVRFGVPMSVMGLLLKGGLTWNLAGIALTAALAIGLWMLGMQLLPKPWQRVVSPTLQIGCALGNTAYFGIPVALALLPAQALPISIGYDLGATLLAWSLGPFWLQRQIHQAWGYQTLLRDVLLKVAASPATRGLMGALIVQATPWSDTIASALWLPSRIVIVLALVVVGMRLGALHTTTGEGQRSPSLAEATNAGMGTEPTPAQQVQAALISKVLLFPCWVWLLSSLLPLSELSRQALVLQAAAPAAISVLLMAEHARRDTDLAAQLILRSTLLALVTVPLWWVVVQRF